MGNVDTSFNLKDSIDFLLKSFKIERYIYLAVTLLSIIILFILIFIMFKEKDYTNILAMLGPTGLVTFSFSRVLKMWGDCIDLVKAYITQNS